MRNTAAREPHARTEIRSPSPLCSLCVSSMCYIALLFAFACVPTLLSAEQHRSAAAQPAHPSPLLWRRSPEIINKRKSERAHLSIPHLTPEFHDDLHPAGLADRLHNFYQVCNASEAGGGGVCEAPTSFYASGVGTTYAYLPAQNGENITLLSTFQLWQLREEARGMMTHAFRSYMVAGYPWDELCPLSCVGRRWDARVRGTLDDSLGGFSTTLVDSLDTLALTGDIPAFKCGLSLVVNEVRLDNDVIVSVFESSIRVLGSLLSAHLLASDPRKRLFTAQTTALNATQARHATHTSANKEGLESGCGAACPTRCLHTYNGELLSMALELADRLLPAFDTPTGVPHHRINLKTGQVDPASRETCTAAGGTFLLEWGLLSKLTGDPMYGAVARRAMSALWGRRSPATGLIGSAVDAIDGLWKVAHTGIGAGVDSYYEYLLKSGVVFDDPSLMYAFEKLADSVEEHLAHAGVHLESSFLDGRPGGRSPLVSALQAFYPGLEVLAGRVLEAKIHFLPLFSLWHSRKALPEILDVMRNEPLHFGRDAPLRPELLESTYYLYTATHDPAYLWAAAQQVRSLSDATRVECGYASLADVDSRRLDDRMDSYFIAETVKYAFLIFDHALVHAEGVGKQGATDFANVGAAAEMRTGRDAALHPLAGLRAASLQHSIFDDLTTPLPLNFVDGETVEGAMLRAAAQTAATAIPAALRFEGEYAVFTTEGHIIDLSHPQLVASRGSAAHRMQAACPVIPVLPSVHSSPVHGVRLNHNWGLPSPLDNAHGHMATFGLRPSADYFLQLYAARNATERPRDTCLKPDVRCASVFSGRECSNCPLDMRCSDDVSVELHDTQLPPFAAAIAPAVRDAFQAHNVIGAQPPAQPIPAKVVISHNAKADNPVETAGSSDLMHTLFTWLSQWSTTQARSRIDQILHSPVDTQNSQGKASAAIASNVQAASRLLYRALTYVDTVGWQADSWAAAEFDELLGILHELVAVRTASWSATDRAAIESITIPDEWRANPAITAIIARRVDLLVKHAPVYSAVQIATAVTQTQDTAWRLSLEMTPHQTGSHDTAPGFVCSQWTRYTLFPPTALDAMLNYGSPGISAPSLLDIVFSEVQASLRTVKEWYPSIALMCDPMQGQCMTTTAMEVEAVPTVLSLTIDDSNGTARGLEFQVATGLFSPIATPHGAACRNIAFANPLCGCMATSSSQRHYEPGTLVIVARGQCSFAEKARTAQAAGAAAVLVLDLQPLAPLPAGAAQGKAYAPLPSDISSMYRPWHPAEFSMAADGKDSVGISTVFVAGQAAAFFVQQLRVRHDSCGTSPCSIAQLAQLNADELLPSSLHSSVPVHAARIYSNHRMVHDQLPISLRLTVTPCESDCNSQTPAELHSKAARYLEELRAEQGAQTWTRDVSAIAVCFQCLSQGNCGMPECQSLLAQCAPNASCTLSQAQLRLATMPSVADALKVVLQSFFF